MLRLMVPQCSRVPASEGAQQELGLPSSRSWATLTFSSRGMTRTPPGFSRLFMYSSCSFCTPAPQYTRSYWRLSAGMSRQFPTTKDGSQNSNLQETAGEDPEPDGGVRALLHLPVEAVAGLDEGVELLAGVLHHVSVELDAVVHATRAWDRKHR